MNNFVAFARHDNRKRVKRVLPIATRPDKDGNPIPAYMKRVG